MAIKKNKVRSDIADFLKEEGLYEEVMAELRAELEVESVKSKRVPKMSATRKPASRKTTGTRSKLTKIISPRRRSAPAVTSRMVPKFAGARRSRTKKLL